MKKIIIENFYQELKDHIYNKYDKDMLYGTEFDERIWFDLFEENIFSTKEPSSNWDFNPNCNKIFIELFEFLCPFRAKFDWENILCNDMCIGTDTVTPKEILEYYDIDMNDVDCDCDYDELINCNNCDEFLEFIEENLPEVREAIEQLNWEAYVEDVIIPSAMESINKELTALKEEGDIYDYYWDGNNLVIIMEAK